MLYPLKDIEARDLLEIAESRHKKASAHDSYTIVIEGKESMQKRKGLTEES